MVPKRKKQNKMPRFRMGVRCAFLAAGWGCATLCGNPVAPPVQKQEVTNPLPVKKETDSPQTLFIKGQAALRSGKTDAAFAYFEKAAALNSGLWSRRAELMAIRLTGQKGDVKNALLRLALFPRRPDAAKFRFRSEALALWLAARSGDPRQFQAQWQAFLTNCTPVPDAEVAEAAEMGVALFLKEKNSKAAADILSHALEYQTSDAARISVLRREFELRREPAEIAAVADRYARWFPDSEETAKIQLHAADRLLNSGNRANAQKLWEEVSGRRAYPSVLRELALESAALAAEKEGNDIVARTMYQSLIAMTNTGFPARLKFGTYLLRTGDLPEAEKIFRDLWLSNDERREIAGADLLRVLIKLKKTEDALTLADRLRNSATYGRYAEIKLAELQEAHGDLAGARSTYQILSRRYPEDPFIGHIAYRIAFLANALHLPGAIGELAAFAEKYPADPRAPRALLQAMQFSGNADAAKPYFDWIVSRYGKDPLFSAAVAQQFAFEMAAGHYPEALLLREKYAASLPDAQFGASCGLAKLHILLGEERWGEALTLGKSLLERYPASDAAVEIAFCCGNAESVIGNYAAALESYGRARELRPAGALGECAKGRIADMCYMLFNQTQQAEFLERAEALYRELSEKSLFPAIRLEAFCQLGRTLELSGRFAESATAYDKVLFCALEMKADKCTPEAIWCYRAAYGAIRIRMRSSRRIDREAALHTAALLEALALGDYEENFTALRRDINRKRNNNVKR